MHVDFRRLLKLFQMLLLRLPTASWFLKKCYKVFCHPNLISHSNMRSQNGKVTPPTIHCSKYSKTHLRRTRMPNWCWLSVNTNLPYKSSWICWLYHEFLSTKPCKMGGPRICHWACHNVPLLVNTFFSQDDFRPIASIIKQLRCSALGLNKHFPRSLLYGPTSLGGLGMTSPFNKNMCHQINYFLFNIRQKSLTSQKFEASIIYTQIETGLFLHSFPYHTRGMDTLLHHHFALRYGK